jgi:hypothetical protein
MTPRRVTIQQDRYSPLYFIACATPCGHGCGVCWLYSSRVREACEQHAENCGWEVVT